MIENLDLKHLGLGVVMSFLAGCSEQVAVSNDISSRAAVSGEQAASMFLKYCYNSPDGSEIKRSPSFTQLKAPEGYVAAKHVSAAVFFQTYGEGRCIMRFGGDGQKVQVRVNAAVALSRSLKLELTRTKHGRPIAIDTNKGEIAFGGGSRVVGGPPGKPYPQEFEISFSQSGGFDPT